MFWRRTNNAQRRGMPRPPQWGSVACWMVRPTSWPHDTFRVWPSGSRMKATYPDGRTRVSRAVEEPPFPTSQRAQLLHFLPTLTCHAEVGGRDERMVDLAPFGEDDDEGARLITQPRHLETRRGHRTPVHHLHPCVRRVERDACVEVAYRQGPWVRPRSTITHLLWISASADAHHGARALPRAIQAASTL
jgi:hypothetical protein